MSKMIERVAKAIHEADEAWTRQKGDSEQGLAEEPKYGLPETLARTAIAAMREPTKEMVEAGKDCPVGHAWSNKGEFITNPDDVFECMIDAALNP